MAENQTPPHGDPLRETVEPNRAQRESDAPADATQEPGGDRARARGQGSTSSGIPAADEDGQTRRRQYSEGAELVSGTD